MCVCLYLSFVVSVSTFPPRSRLIICNAGKCDYGCARNFTAEDFRQCRKNCEIGHNFIRVISTGCYLSAFFCVLSLVKSLYLCDLTTNLVCGNGPKLLFFFHSRDQWHIQGPFGGTGRCVMRNIFVFSV